MGSGRPHGASRVVGSPGISQALIHLDTSFLIRALAPSSAEDKRLRSWLKSEAPLGISSVCWAEFLCGPLSADQLELVARIVGAPEPFLQEDSIVTARLFNQSGRRRGSLLDCMIAATAIRVDASLATAHSTDFLRFESEGLRLVSS